MTPEQEEQQLLQQEFAALVAWARQRDTVATLDSSIKQLVVRKIGALTTDQVQYLNAQRTLVPFGVVPTAFVRGRAGKMLLTDEERKGLGAPDLSDHAESQMIIWALSDILSWLEEQPDRSRHYVQLVMAYQEALTNAKDLYTQLHGSLIAVKAINMVMTLARARNIIKADEKG